MKEIWTPRDAIDTANAFHAELARSERGVAVDDPTDGEALVPH